MKTTTALSLLRKLNKLTIKSTENKYPLSKSSKSYIFVTKIANGAKTIRPCYTSGTGRFCSNLNYTGQTCELLKKLGIEFELTNDSKRGGLPGNLITITTKIKL